MATTSRWQRIRKYWMVTGVTVTVIFVAWCLLAYRASPDAKTAMRSDARVTVDVGNGVYRFTSTSHTQKAPVGLLFFAGSLVDPVAYAPLARALALSGYPVILVPLPRRGAFGGADGGEVLGIAQGAIHEDERALLWVIGGHSRGAVVAVRMVVQLASLGAGSVGGLLLVGTSHPRDVSLAQYKLPVTKIVATRDGLATLEKNEANKALLPPSTHWVRIEGGNHSQFGWYGFQPGDRFATISRESQQQQTVSAIIDALRRAADPRRLELAPLR